MRLGSAAALTFALALFTAPGDAASLIAADKIAGLKPADVSGFTEAYVRPGVNPSAYHAIAIAPLAFVQGQEQPVSGFDRSYSEGQDGDVGRITEPNREDLARHFDGALKSALGERRAILAGPAPNALVIQPILMMARPNRVPYDMRSREWLNAYSYGVGAAAVEIDVRDGATGQLLMVLAARRLGQPFPSNYNKAFFWGDVEEFMTAWAHRLETALPAAPSTG